MSVTIKLTFFKLLCILFCLTFKTTAKLLNSIYHFVSNSHSLFSHKQNLEYCPYIRIVFVTLRKRYFIHVADHIKVLLDCLLYQCRSFIFINIDVSILNFHFVDLILIRCKSKQLNLNLSFNACNSIIY